jgi:hypothetical protein
MNVGHFWTTQELRQLIDDYSDKPPDISDREFAAKWAPAHKFSTNAAWGQLGRLKLDGRIKQRLQISTYPVYDEPLTMEGDALVLPDMEMPFHHAEFINKCLDLAEAWGVRQCILAGDVLHFDSLSGWQPNWKAPDAGGLTTEAEKRLMEYAMTQPAKRQGELMALIGDIGQKSEQDGASTELMIARKELGRLAEQFDKIDFVIGNHEGRLLRALNTVLDPQELKQLLTLGDKWRIAPYYFSYLVSAGEKYCIDHPKSAAASTAAVLASKFQCHCLMAHSHHFGITTDVSGKYLAAEIGHCVDEARLPYAAQRHTRAPAHLLGAAIVRGGFATILTRFTDWRSLLRD